MIKRSGRKGKKWAAKLPDGSTVHFGATGYEDFTQHHDETRKRSYIARHRHDGTAIDTAGFWSRELLWSKPSMQAAIRHVESMTGHKIRL